MKKIRRAFSLGLDPEMFDYIQKVRIKKGLSTTTSALVDIIYEHAKENLHKRISDTKCPRCPCCGKIMVMVYRGNFVHQERWKKSKN